MEPNLEKRAGEGQKKDFSVDLLKGVDDASKYSGKYVAFRVGAREVIAFGEDPVEVREKAREKGVDAPLISYVQEPGIEDAYPEACNKKV